MNELNELFLPVTAFLFALFFYYASTQKGCWYKRYVFPAMFTFFAFFHAKNTFAAILFILAAILSAFGQKGYGREKIEEEKKKEEAEKE